ncbi:glycosyltransferase [Megasphaera sp.]|uniref:glycosyltransferase n=1 Tax=Megasphaera sp. TaxID=2023260 RepID=UPI003FED6C0C
MAKVLFVATVVKKHIMEFHLPFLKMFQEHGWQTAVAARNDYDNPADCQIPFCDDYYDIPFERNPFKAGNITAYKKLKKIIDTDHYDIIHCHTPVGAALARLAAREARRKGTKVIYTAHGFHFYKGAPLINWLIFYPTERWLAHDTDVLITINKEDYKRAQSFKAGKVVYVPGVGVDLKKFHISPIDKVKKREELGIPNDDFVLLSVGELIPRKNHQVVLRALGILKQQGKLENIQYIICGQGDKLAELRKLAQTLNIAENVHFLGYRRDISEICNASDVFMFMSLQEGLPVALMEAMACGLPAVCTDIRGNTELVDNGVTGLIVANTPEDTKRAIERLQDKAAFRDELSVHALSKIKQFDLSHVLPIMQNIYRGGELNAIFAQQQLRHELGIPLSATVLLSVGEVNRNKNHAICIKALAKLHLPNVYYVICGSGPLMQKNQQLAKKLGIAKQVIFTGYHQDVAVFYKMADIFLFPSQREGLSLALMEAMANGLPVICSDIRGNRDLIQNRRGGYLVTKSDVKQWYFSISRLINKKTMWIKYGSYNQRRINISFSSSIVEKKMKTIYLTNIY